MQADPAWPAVALAVIHLLDGLACVGPIEPIRQALDRVECPPRIRRLLPPIKFAAAAGLVAGLWLPGLGLVTCLALVVYFLLAIASHLRVHDRIVHTIGAVAMLAIVIAVTTTFL